MIDRMEKVCACGHAFWLHTAEYGCSGGRVKRCMCRMRYIRKARGIASPR